MGNVVVTTPRRWTEHSLRPFVSGGFGCIHMSQDRSRHVFPFNSNIPAFNIGAGALDSFRNGRASASTSATTAAWARSDNPPEGPVAISGESGYIGYMTRLGRRRAAAVTAGTSRERPIEVLDPIRTVSASLTVRFWPGAVCRFDTSSVSSTRCSPTGAEPVSEGRTSVTLSASSVSGLDTIIHSGAPRTATCIGIAETFRRRTVGATPGLLVTVGVSTTIDPVHKPRRYSSAPHTSFPCHAAVRRDTSASRTPSRSAVFANSNVIGRCAEAVRGGIGSCASLLARMVNRRSAMAIQG